MGQKALGFLSVRGRKSSYLPAQVRKSLAIYLCRADSLRKSLAIYLCRADSLRKSLAIYLRRAESLSYLFAWGKKSLAISVLDRRFRLC